MDLFSQDDLHQLLGNQQTPCVSLLMPTTRGAKMEDQLLFKNLIGQAEELLVAQGRRTPEAKDLLSPAREMYENAPYWTNVSNGLAAFLAPGFSRSYRVPLALTEQVVAGNHFHIKPLLPLLSGEGRFHVLVLRPTGLRLLEGTPNTVREMDLRKVPINVAEAFAYGDEPARREAVATGTRPSRPPAVFETGGLAGNVSRKQMMEYLHQVDCGLRELLAKEETPLVAAGTADLLELYQQANSYRHTLSEGVECHPDQLSPEQIAHRAWELVCRHVRQAVERAAGRYRQLAGTGGTANDITEIVAATFQGRIQELFVDRRRSCWGVFDPITQNATLHDHQESGDEDLLNVAAVHTLIHKGTVYAVEPDELPDKTPLAAIFWLPIGERSSKSFVSDTAVRV